MKKIIQLILISTFFWSCSTTVQSEADKPLVSNLKSPDTEAKIKEIFVKISLILTSVSGDSKLLIKGLSASDCTVVEQLQKKVLIRISWIIFFILK